MNKRNNGTTLKKIATIISVTIGSIVILGAIASGSVAVFKSNQAYEVSRKNKEDVIENDKRIAILENKIDDLIDGQKEMNNKLDEALRR